MASGGVDTPLEKLRLEYERCMKVSAKELDLEPPIYIHEGSELISHLRDQLAMLPELEYLTPQCDISTAYVGVSAKSTPEEERKLRSVLVYHNKIFLGDGNAAPAPARGVICDLDVGDAQPIALRPRSVGPHILPNVYELLKKLLETNLIEHSESPWASPIVLVLKKNGIDIRTCIDYRVVNGFLKLSCYPLPLIDDLLIGFEDTIFMSGDMASGFWTVKMSERAKLISAFVCPFGYFQWVGMPFGLKNALLIYQAVINNRLWGFVRLSPEEEADVDSDVLQHLGLTFGPERDCRTEPQPEMGPVLGRSSYINDIAHDAATWDQLCDDLNELLFRLRYWNISVSLPKSRIWKARTFLTKSAPKEYVPFRKLRKDLNYYHKFIEDFPVIAASLYELTEERIRSGRYLLRVKDAFEILKWKIVSTPLLRHPDRSRPFVIIPHANQWAACAVLGQVYDGTILPVRFTGRVLNDSGSRYHIAEKEVIAIPRVLRSEMGSHFETADGRCVPWNVALSHWDITVQKVQRDEDGLPAIMGAGITSREHLEKVAESLIPEKGHVRAPPVVSVEMLGSDYDGIVLSFDGAAKTSTKKGSFIQARCFILETVTVNDAKYQGLRNGLVMTFERNVEDLVVWEILESSYNKYKCQTLKEKEASLRQKGVLSIYGLPHVQTLASGENSEVTDQDEFAHLEQYPIMKPMFTPDEEPKDPNKIVQTKASPEETARVESTPLPPAAKVLAVLIRSSERNVNSERPSMG
ncbi:reverse transcriptase [Phytophthora megakarya]|uniref:Reverse transcriptase n=1 Tax=Phytophthora megakarya TaxID=4795 RepID=A0A225V468_9STRA|nr:reverse transcriptase [Phytophthora megakarya]